MRKDVIVRYRMMDDNPVPDYDMPIGVWVVEQPVAADERRDIDA
jgi:hypothetical protein